MFFNTQTFTNNINGTKVTLKVNFRSYSSRFFREDVSTLKKVYSLNKSERGSIPKEMEAKLELGLFYEFPFKRELLSAIKRLGGIDIFSLSYHKFKKIGSNFLSQFLFYFLKLPEFKNIIENKSEFLIEVSIVNGSKENIYAQFKDTLSSFNKITLEFSGSFILGRIVLPWVYLKKTDDGFIFKTLNHELQHYIKFVRGIYAREYAVQEKVAKLLELNPKKVAAFPTIYEILSNFYTEGIAVFQERRNSSYVPFDLEKINDIKNKIELISLSKKKAKNIYEDTFPDSESSEYYLGYLICYFIGLSIQKKKKYKLNLISPEKKTLDYDKLNDYLYSYQKVYLDPLNPKIFLETYNLLSTIKHFNQFIALFELSCQELELQSPIKFIDKKWIGKLFRNIKA